MSQARDRDNLAICRPDYDWRDTSEIYFVWMQDSERHACTTTRIDRVSTCVQDRISRLSSKIMTGGHSMAVAVKRWAHVKSSPVDE
jgi:hypothetical protein